LVEGYIFVNEECILRKYRFSKKDELEMVDVIDWNIYYEWVKNRPPIEASFSRISDLLRDEYSYWDWSFWSWLWSRRI